MQYLGRIISSAKRMYMDLNSATLNGAIDVIVVRYPDGELVSSPFYVQFGKTGILRPCEDEVEVSINGIPRPDVRMRVNRLGQAYFDILDVSSAVSDKQDDLTTPAISYSRPCSARVDSGIHLHYPSEQSHPTSDTSGSPPPISLPLMPTQIHENPVPTAVLPPATNDGSSYGMPKSTSAEEALLHSVPNLLQSVDFGEFESYMHWWNQDGGSGSWSSQTRGQIHIYRLTDEQSEAMAPQEAHTDVWVFWDNKWYSWKTANIKLRFLRNLGTPLPQGLELKLMEVDRENPAFTLLPERPATLGETNDPSLQQLLEYEDEETQFNLDHCGGTCPVTSTTKGPVFLRPIKICSDTEETPIKSRGPLFPDYPGSLPGTPRAGSPTAKERAYFSDGYSPMDSDDEMSLNRQLERQWTKAQNTRAFRLTSDDLKRLDLDDGVNEAVFTTINKYQGSCSCYCLIYVWKSTDKIIVSDVDGTITKSDLLGHVLHWMGVEWIHPGVIQLFKKISENGFRLMYLSARSIGQAGLTRTFLEGAEQGGQQLPPGPIILSPNSLITTIQMEVIRKCPQVLKIANLNPLCDLFRARDPNAPCPFYAGFGNRTSDVDTYRAIGIPDSRIFIVNPEGCIETASGLQLPTGYTSLCDVADTIFPSVFQELPQSAVFSDFSFWRDQPLSTPITSPADDHHPHTPRSTQKCHPSRPTS